MAIGDLYDANNVVVGQAAVFIAPSGTALPTFGTLVQSDPFSTAPWTSQTLTVAATSTYTLSDTNGNVTSGLTTASTGVQIQAALSALGDTNNWTVTGTASPYTISSTGDDGPLTANASAGSAVLTAGLWVPVGATDQGWKYGTNKSVSTINIEEQSTPVAQAINSQSVTLDGSLSEDITRTMALAYNATVSKTAPGTGVPGYDAIALTDSILLYAVALVTNHVNGRPRIIYAPKWTQLTNASTDFRRSTAKRMYPVSFATLCKPSQIVVYNFTANAQ